ncbi:MAG: hypothetical protein OHK0057_34990 [Thermoflexibacter sp.]
MNQQLADQFAEFESKRKTLLSQLQAVAEKKLHVELHGKWSIIQNINHLILSESGILTYLQKKIQGVDTLKEAGLASWFAYQLVLLYSALPFKRKAPKGIDQPSNEEDLATISAKWDKLRENWREFISQVPENQLKIAIFKHPFLSTRLNIYQTIGFMEAHFERHSRQIENILKS